MQEPKKARINVVSTAAAATAATAATAAAAKEGTGIGRSYYVLVVSLLPLLLL